MNIKQEDRILQMIRTLEKYRIEESKKGVAFRTNGKLSSKVSKQLHKIVARCQEVDQ